LKDKYEKLKIEYEDQKTFYDEALEMRTNQMDELEIQNEQLRNMVQLNQLNYHRQMIQNSLMEIWLPNLKILKWRMITSTRKSM
jgi:hypothetical protein